MAQKEKLSFCLYQDYFQPGEAPIATLVSAKDLLLHEVPQSPALPDKEHLTKMAAISFGSGLETLLLQGVKLKTIVNSIDIQSTHLLFRLSRAEIDDLKGDYTDNIDRSVRLFQSMVQRGVPIHSEIIDRIEQSSQFDWFRLWLAEFRKPTDLSQFEPYRKMGLVDAFDLSNRT